MWYTTVIPVLGSRKMLIANKLENIHKLLKIIHESMDIKENLFTNDFAKMLTSSPWIYFLENKLLIK